MSLSSVQESSVFYLNNKVDMSLYIQCPEWDVTFAFFKTKENKVLANLLLNIGD